MCICEVSHPGTCRFCARIACMIPQVQAAYSLFQDGRNNGLTKKGFKERMHDKFAVVLSNKVVADIGMCCLEGKGIGGVLQGRRTSNTIVPSQTKKANAVDATHNA